MLRSLVGSEMCIRDRETTKEVPRPEAAAPLLWWRPKAATFVVAMNRVDVVDLVVDLVDVDLDVDLVDVDLVDVDLVDVDLVDVDIERAIDKKEIKTRAPDVRLTHRLVHLRRLRHSRVLILSKNHSNIKKY